MRPISEIYAASESRYWSDYQPMLKSLGHEILLQVDDSDYQGDSRLLFRDGQRIGYLQFGWGSCSGCDSLQACSSLAEVEELRMSLVLRTKWFADSAAALVFFKTHDWQGDYSWHAEEQRRFVSESITLLENPSAIVPEIPPEPLRVPMPSKSPSGRPHPLADVVYWIVYRVDESRAGGEFHSYLIARESDDFGFFSCIDDVGPTKYYLESEAIAAAKATYHPLLPTGIQCYRTTVTQTLIAP